MNPETPTPSPTFPSTNPFNAEDRARMRDVLNGLIQRAEYGRLIIRIPTGNGRFQRIRGMHYHFKPEIFVQLRGRTEFRFPKDEFMLQEGEVAIMPTGLPHHETVYPGDQPFQNMVIGFYSSTISVHFAFEIRPRVPEIAVIEFFDAPNLDTFISVVESLQQSHRMHAPARDQAVKGFSIALFAMLRNLVEVGNDRLNHDHGKVFQAKWIIREQISNPELSVKLIAEMLQCSADYLSHLFHRETGENLIHYIQRQRIQGAAMALKTTPHSVSEIAWGSGFSDPAYFTRVFKKFTGYSPHAFRQLAERQRDEREMRPKTIYHSREDYSPGVPFTGGRGLSRPVSQRAAT